MPLAFNTLAQSNQSIMCEIKMHASDLSDLSLHIQSTLWAQLDLKQLIYNISYYSIDKNQYVIDKKLKIHGRKKFVLIVSTGPFEMIIYMPQKKGKHKPNGETCQEFIWLSEHICCCYWLLEKWPTKVLRKKTVEDKIKEKPANRCIRLTDG